MFRSHGSLFLGIALYLRNMIFADLEKRGEAAARFSSDHGIREPLFHLRPTTFRKASGSPAVKHHSSGKLPIHR